ncbi:MAG: alpha/beta hydrolase, partial [Pseudomonadota bacterium]
PKNMRLGLAMRCLSILSLFLLAQCSPTDVLNAVTPTKSIKSIETHSYGPEPRQALDVYAPASPKDGAPVLVFFYGGSWESGEKGDYKFVAEAFTSAGYTAVLPDYRVYPEVIYPTFLEDAASAVAWTTKRFPQRPIALIGHSAGGHIALMLGLDTPFLGQANVARCETIVATAALSAPVGIMPLKREPYISIFPDRMTAKDAPLRNVSAKTAPVLLMTGLKDTSVLPANSEKIAAALTDAGAEVQLTTYPDMKHADTAKYLSHFFDEDASLRADLLTFLEQAAQQSAPYCNP